MMTTEVRTRAVPSRENAEWKREAAASRAKSARHAELLFDLFADGQRPVVCCLMAPEAIPGSGVLCRELAFELAASQAESGHRVCLLKGTSLLAGLRTEDLEPEKGDRGANVWTLSSGSATAAGAAVVSLDLPETIAALRRQFSYVLLDGPAVASTPRAAVVAGLADKTVLLVRKGSVRRPALRAAHQSLLTREARVVGVVLLDALDAAGETGRHG